MFLDTRQYGTTWRDIYRMAISFVQPRPIALVSTLSADAVRNLAPFSFYNMVSANPPVVMFCPSFRRDGSGKDSLHNIEAIGEFVVATVTESIVSAMNQCSFDHPPNVDEFAVSGLTPEPARFVRPALVGESPVNIECTLVDIKRFGKQPGAGSVIFGQIVAMHVDDRLLASDGAVDAAKLKAIGRMGRFTYCRTRDTFDVPRPTT
jgi:flavin reductase (DIM6/NTAB) family NADH-FMN oxidoreductase RutF